MWIIQSTESVATWIESFDDATKQAVLFILEEIGPSLGRPYVDSIKQSRHRNLKELRIRSRGHVLRLFDPRRKIVLLIGGDKRGDKRFYQKMIPLAEALYDKHLKSMEVRNE